MPPNTIPCNARRSAIKPRFKDAYAWVGPVVRFTCGAILGALAGIGLYAEWFPDDPGWLVIPASALICGILAAIFGDRFWTGWFDPS